MSILHLQLMSVLKGTERLFDCWSHFLLYNHLHFPHEFLLIKFLRLFLLMNFKMDIKAIASKDLFKHKFINENQIQNLCP